MSSESSTPTTDSQPTSTSHPAPASPSSAPPAWLPNVLTTASSTLLALWAISKVGAFLPATLNMLATDAISWAPLGLALLSIVAIASPVSLAPLVSLIKGRLSGGKDS